MSLIFEPNAMSSQQTHLVPLPMPVLGGYASGVATAILNEALSNQREFILLTTDERPEELGSARIVPVDDGIKASDNDLLKYRVECGQWQLLHPDSYTPKGCPEEVLEEMFINAAGWTIRHSHDLARFVEFNKPLNVEAKERQFARRFGGGLTTLPPGSVVHHQGYFAIPTIEEFSNELERLGVYQTYHHHEGLPDNLTESEWGRRFLRTISRVDAVFVHTDVHVERLQRQLDALSLMPPDIRRFDLGVGVPRLKHALHSIDRYNYKNTFPKWSLLDVDQQLLIDEVFATQNVVPHRFVCIDRMDPVKGTATLLEGIRRFLRQESMAATGAERLRDRFRFFFVQNSQWGRRAADEPAALNARYRKAAHAMRANLQREFPGIVFCCNALEHDHGSAIGSLLRGCHAISGSVDEGLNLAVLECAKVNSLPDRDQPAVGILLGSGAGFALQTKRNGNGHLAYFVDGNDPQQYARALGEMVCLQKDNPILAREKLLDLVRLEVDPRTASMLEWQAQS